MIYKLGSSVVKNDIQLGSSVVPSFFVFVEPLPVVAKVLALDAAGNVCNRIVNCLI